MADDAEKSGDRGADLRFSLERDSESTFKCQDLERTSALPKCNGIGFAGHFQTGNGPDYILLRRIYLSTGQLVAGSLQAAY